jgi:hypothetical protein
MPPYVIVILDKELMFAGCSRRCVEDYLKFPWTDIFKQLPESDKKYYREVTRPFIKIVTGR